MPPITDEEKIDNHVDLIAYIVQEATGCSDRVVSDLKNALAEFAEEIKRQAIEPEGK